MAANLDSRRGPRSSEGGAVALTARIAETLNRRPRERYGLRISEQLSAA
jgi:hypothetical protein